MVRRVLFLPGASGRGSFWAPVARLLPASWRTESLDWPGLGDVPPDPRVTGFDGLVDLVLDRIDAPTEPPLGQSDGQREAGPHQFNGRSEPGPDPSAGSVDLVAQSMGGVVAVQAALRRPDLVRRLVLAATSGGIDLSPFGVADWRPAYRESFPSAAPWIMDYRADFADPIRTVRVPTLLLWTDTDAISPPSVGAHLATLLPNATLVVIPGGDHAFARDRADEVAPHILRHLDC